MTDEPVRETRDFSKSVTDILICHRHMSPTYVTFSLNQFFENYPGPYSLTSFKQDDVPDLHSTIPAALHSAFVLAFTQEKQRILGFCLGGFLSITTLSYHCENDVVREQHIFFAHNLLVSFD